MIGYDTNWLINRLAKEKAASAKSENHEVPHDAVEMESDLHDQIITECRRRGWIVVHSRMDAPTTTAKGVPDFIVFADQSRTFLFECKSRTGKLTTEQLGFSMMASILGFTVHVVRSFSEFLAVINEPSTKTATTP